MPHKDTHEKDTHTRSKYLKNTKTIRAWMLMQKPFGGRWIPCPTDNPFIRTTRSGAKEMEKREVGNGEFRKIQKAMILLPPEQTRKKRK